MGASHQRHQREADPEFITVKDLLVGEKGDRLTIDDGDLRLKWQTRGPVKDQLLDDGKTAVASKESCKNWNHPKGQCPRQPGSCHKWKECTLFQESQASNEGSLPLTRHRSTMNKPKLDGKGPPSRAAAMAPSIRPPQFQDAEDLGQKWQDPKETGKGPAAKMSWMPLRRTHPKGMANERG